jgi:hypothetical protein
MSSNREIKNRDMRCGKKPEIFLNLPLIVETNAEAAPQTKFSGNVLFDILF